MAAAGPLCVLAAATPAHICICLGRMLLGIVHAWIVRGFATHRPNRHGHNCHMASLLTHISITNELRIAIVKCILPAMGCPIMNLKFLSPGHHPSTGEICLDLVMAMITMLCCAAEAYHLACSSTASSRLGFYMAATFVQIEECLVLTGFQDVNHKQFDMTVGLFATAAVVLHFYHPAESHSSKAKPKFRTLLESDVCKKVDGLKLDKQHHEASRKSKSRRKQSPRQVKDAGSRKTVKNPTDDVPQKCVDNSSFDEAHSVGAVQKVSRWAWEVLATTVTSKKQLKCE